MIARSRQLSCRSRRSGDAICRSDLFWRLWSVSVVWPGVSSGSHAAAPLPSSEPSHGHKIKTGIFSDHFHHHCPRHAPDLHQGGAVQSVQSRTMHLTRQRDFVGQVLVGQEVDQELAVIRLGSLCRSARESCKFLFIIFLPRLSWK